MRKLALSLATLLAVCLWHPPSARAENSALLIEEFNAEFEEYKRLRRLILSPETSPKDRADAEAALGPVVVLLNKLKAQINKQGGQVPEFEAWRPGPKRAVRAKDRRSGASTQKPVASWCKRYASYKRPTDKTTRQPVTAMFLPRNWRQRARALVGTRLIALENQLVRHLTMCKAVWTRQDGLVWQARRQALIQQILTMQERYIWSQVMTDAEWTRFDQGVARAFSNNTALREAQAVEKKAHEKYMRLKRQYEDWRERGKITDAPRRLWIMRLEKFAIKARIDYYRKAQARHHLKRQEMTRLAGAMSGRRSAGIATIQAGDTHLTPATAAELQSSRSARIVRLLGAQGVRILEAESARRNAAERAATSRSTR